MNLWENRDNYWKKIKHPDIHPDVWIPNAARRRTPQPYKTSHFNNQTGHDLGVGDIYCAFYPHKLENGDRIFTDWNRGRDDIYDQIGQDARAKVFAVWANIEHERGSHPILSKPSSEYTKDYWEGSLNYKLDRYAAYMGRTDEPLLMTVEDWSTGSYDPEGTEAMFDEYLAFIGSYKIARNILLAKHRDVCGDPDHTEGEIHHDDLGDPFGDVWYCPAEPQAPMSIQAFLRSKQTSK